MFKIGDKVKILPSAVDIGLFSSEIDKTAVVTENPYMGKYIRILMDDICSNGGYHRSWVVNPIDITPVIRVGQQLLLWGEI